MQFSPLFLNGIYSTNLSKSYFNAEIPREGAEGHRGIGFAPSPVREGWEGGLICGSQRKNSASSAVFKKKVNAQNTLSQLNNFEWVA